MGFRDALFDHLSYVKWGFGVRGGRWVIAPSELVSLVCGFRLFYFAGCLYRKEPGEFFFSAFDLLCFNYDFFIHLFLWILISGLGSHSWSFVLCNILHSVGGIFCCNFLLVVVGFGYLVGIHLTQAPGGV